jgi:hypothetical protein
LLGGGHVAFIFENAREARVGQGAAAHSAG